MILKEMISKLEFTNEIRYSLEKNRDNNITSWEKTAKNAYQGENFDFFLCHKSPFERLAVVVFLMAEKYDLYRKLGIPEDVIVDTFQDLSLRAGIYFERTGEAGLTEDDVIWFRHIMNVEIFKIGCIQFQCFQMLYLEGAQTEPFYMIYSDGVKKWLTPGTPVINCHIQRGAKLDNESVTQSFDKARLFFKEHFPEIYYSYFLCYSWLLYPPMTTRLPQDSHIRSFAERFQIIGTCTDAEQAMENLFPERKFGERKTFLQQMAINHKERFGLACGIIPL